MNTEYFLPSYIASIGKDYKYADDDLSLDKDKLFLNDFYLSKHTTDSYKHNISYRSNSDGYRDDDFKPNVDMLVAGCSNTFGIGIPEEARYSNILAKKLGMTFSNIGIPGASVFLIVSEIMHYFKVYGHPKYLFCMFPDLARMTVYVKRGLNEPYQNWSGFGISQVQLMSEGNIDARPKYIKKPFLYEDVMSVETAYFYSLKAIQMLEDYCKAAGITLYWGALWDIDDSMFMSLKNNNLGYYQNYIGSEDGHWQRTETNNGKDQYIKMVVVPQKNAIPEDINCHEELRSEFPDYFDMACDTEYGIIGAHYGFHRNIHIAEQFYKKVMENVIQ